MILLDRRVRGFRLVDLVAAALLVALILGVYLAKTMAGRERTQIARVERQIDEEQARIRLLQAEVAHLEEPARLEHLSETYLGMAPAPIKHVVSPDTLNDVARAALVGGKIPLEAPPAHPHPPAAPTEAAPR